MKGKKAKEVEEKRNMGNDNRGKPVKGMEME